MWILCITYIFRSLHCAIIISRMVEPVTWWLHLTYVLSIRFKIQVRSWTKFLAIGSKTSIRGRSNQVLSFDPNSLSLAHGRCRIRNSYPNKVIMLQNTDSANQKILYEIYFSYNLSQIFPVPWALGLKDGATKSYCGIRRWFDPMRGGIFGKCMGSVNLAS